MGTRRRDPDYMGAGGAARCNEKFSKLPKMADQSFQILAADHTGFTVSNLEQSLKFWRDILGFEESHRAHHTGDLASDVTGVPGAEILLVVLKGYGHKIELLQYL